MSLKAYVATLQALMAATPFVAATSFSYEERPPSTGLIKGTVLFVDGSQLDFKEFPIDHSGSFIHIIFSRRSGSMRVVVRH